VKICDVTQTKFNQLSEENIHMIIDQPTKHISVTSNISKSYNHKMAAETSWHRYCTKLRIIRRHLVRTHDSLRICITDGHLYVINQYNEVNEVNKTSDITDITYMMNTA